MRAEGDRNHRQNDLCARAKRPAAADVGDLRVAADDTRNEAGRTVSCLEAKRRRDAGRSGKTTRAVGLACGAVHGGDLFFLWRLMWNGRLPQSVRPNERVVVSLEPQRTRRPLEYLLLVRVGGVVLPPTVRRPPCTVS